MTDAARSLQSRAGIGLTANVVQQRSLRISSVAVDNPALILLTHGRKTLGRGTRRWTAQKGDAIVVAGGQTLDIENRLSEDGLFESRWVVWDASLFPQAAPLTNGVRKVPDVAILKQVSAGFTIAVKQAVEAIIEESTIPSRIAGHRMIELFLWLAEHGVTLAGGRQTSTASKLRGMILETPATQWTVAAAAGQIATSEATLRRRLGAEGTSFNAVLTDARMSLAMTLLQSTERSVATIASDVGYESPSRFAVRFKNRFGFAPSAIRGHQR